MSLTVKRAGKEEYGHQLKVLIAGAPGQGKTRLCSSAPNVLYAATSDAGLMSVVDRRCPFVDITDSDQIETLRKTLALNAESRKSVLGVDVDTVVIDTIDGVQRLLVEERLKQTKKDQLTLHDYQWLGDQLRGIVRAYRNLPIHTIFTVHIKSTEDPDTGRTSIRPALVGAMADELAAYVDVAMILKATPRVVIVNGESRQKLVRTGLTSPDAQHTWLKDRSGKLPMEFDVNLNDDFERMYRSIFGDEATLPETTTEAVVGEEENVATPTPVAKKTAAKKTAAPKQDAPQQTLEPQQDPEPEKQPVFGEAHLVAEGRVGATKPVAEPESTTTVEAPVIAEEPPAPSAKTGPPCSNCGTPVDDEDQLDLSLLRYKQPYCRPCFVNPEVKKAKK